MIIFNKYYIAPLEGDSMYFSRDQPFASGHDPEDEEDRAQYHHPPVKFVYDAVEERTRQWQAGLGLITTNGTH